MNINDSFQSIAKKWHKHTLKQEPQVLFGRGKKYGATLLSDYANMFGNIIKIRFSKRRGFCGIIEKDGRKIRWR